MQQGRFWSALARVGEVRLVVQAHDLPVGLALDRVTDLAERYP
ncbi:hypothetical protein [Aquipuribacter sp. MA13-6]